MIPGPKECRCVWSHVRDRCGHGRDVGPPSLQSVERFKHGMGWLHECRNPGYMFKSMQKKARQAFLVLLGLRLPKEECILVRVHLRNEYLKWHTWRVRQNSPGCLLQLNTSACNLIQGERQLCDSTLWAWQHFARRTEIKTHKHNHHTIRNSWLVRSWDWKVFAKCCAQHLGVSWRQVLVSFLCPLSSTSVFSTSVWAEWIFCWALMTLLWAAQSMRPELCVELSGSLRASWWHWSLAD